MRTIDCRDMPVPKPVVLAKSTLEELPKDCAVVFIVNGDMSEDNILAYAQNKGYFVKCERKKAGTFITISKSFSCEIDYNEEKEKKIQDRALILTSDCIGRGLRGDELMQNFLNALLLQKTLPSKIVFINHGVKLVCSTENNPNIETIKELEDKGVQILVCMKSLSDYELFEKQCIGKGINMYDLAEIYVNCTISSL